MTLAVVVLALVGAYLMLEVGCNRGLRLPGVSWFEIQGQMQGASKKSKGRMQQTRAARKAKTRR